MTKNEALRVEIEEGQIILNSVSVLVDQTDVKILEIDSSSKYATTLRVFYDPRDFVLWTCIAEWSSYTLFVALFPIIEGKLIWLKEQK